MGSEAPPNGGPAARIAAFVPRQRLQRTASEVPARGHHEVARFTVHRRVIEADVGEVVFVEHVVDVERGRQV